MRTRVNLIPPLGLMLVVMLGVANPEYSDAAPLGAVAETQGEERFPTLENAVAEIERLNEEIDAIDASYAKKAERARKQGDVKTDYVVLGLAEAAPLRARVFALENHPFVLGAESLEAELGAYDNVKKEFSVRFRSTISAVRIAKKASIPLSPAEAQIFQQQWKAGQIKPQATVTLIDDPVLVLINQADNSTLTFASGAFMTAQARQEKLELTFRPLMVVIPAGSFEMGSIEFGPVHSVIFKRGFEMSATEVTQAQWRTVMGKDPLRLDYCGDQCPVEKVSWEDAQAYLQKLNAKTRKQYRLPSEAEWEYACRAGSQQQFCGGNEASKLAWFIGNSGNARQPVAKKQANAFGLFDMSGNVWEWVADDYQPSYDKAPVDGGARQGTGAMRVVRGGSRSMGELGIGAAMRDGFEPTFRFPSMGFRIARTLPE